MTIFFSQVNDNTLLLAAAEAMQFDHALDRILQEILLTNPAYGPVLMFKYDISDGFYHVNLNMEDIPKLGVVFPTAPGTKTPVASLLVLTMCWKSSPPIFCTTTETIANLANRLFIPPWNLKRINWMTRPRLPPFRK